MADSILPFSLAQSNEKLTDRGAVAMADEFGEAVGLPEKVEEEFPAPGSNRGIDPSAYVRTLIYQFSEGGRHIEDTRQIKADEGFRSLIDLDQMPGPDAIGDWLRRMGSQDVESQDGQKALRACNDMLVKDMLVKRYLKKDRTRKGNGKEESQGEGLGSEEEAGGEKLTLDVDATIIEADKGDGKRSYDGAVGYHPMLGFLSDGRRRPCCSFVEFRPGNASPQVGVEEAIRHTLELVEEGQSLKYFRSDSAAYQSDVVDLLDDENVGYTITADLGEAVWRAIEAVPEGSWEPL